MSLLGNGIDETLIPPGHINLTLGSKVTAEDYQHMIGIIRNAKGSDFENLGLESCTIEDELNKVPEKLFNVSSAEYSLAQKQLASC